MMKKLPVILLWLFAIALQLQLIYIYMQPSDVVIDVEEVFNEFAMKKELEKKAQSIETTQKTIADSLVFELSQLEKIYNQTTEEEEKHKIESQYQRLREYTERRTEKMQEELLQVAQNFDDQIWNQLNGYLKDFGKKQGVNIIFGKIQNNIMYNATDKDRTQEAIQFINNRYQGK